MKPGYKITGKLVILITAILSCNLYAQETEKNAQPLELPNFIIEGIEKLNVRSGIKQFPEDPGPLDKSRLDTLNSLEKQPSLLLPMETLPERQVSKPLHNGYILGQFGGYMTPAVEAGYGFDLDGYKIYGSGGFETSDGHIKNSAFTKIGLNLAMDYIAPDKYWIFGGSRTRTSLNVRNNSYILYSNEPAPGRNMFNLEAKIGAEGTYEGYQYGLGGSFETLNMSGAAGTADDNGFAGYLTIKNLWSKYSLGGSLMMDLHSYRGTGVNFLQGTIFGSYQLDKVTFKGTGGLQTSNSSTNVRRGGLLLDGEIDYLIDNEFSFKAEISTGLENNSFEQSAKMNPYISDTTDMDFCYDIALAKAFIYFHPFERLNFSAGGRLKIASRLPVFAGTADGKFKIIYPDATVGSIIAEGFWEPWDKDNFTANLTMNFSSMADNSKAVPYIAPMNFSIFYKRNWGENFGTHFGFTYIGTRYVDIENKEKLEGEINLEAGAEYNFTKSLSAFLRFDNLTNSDIYIWDKYKERNFFFNLGVLWQF